MVAAIGNILQISVVAGAQAVATPVSHTHTHGSKPIDYG